MAIIAFLVFIAVMCAGIYLIAIYALPILGGLAAYSILKQIDASAPTITVVSIATGLTALAAARAGASARNGVIRFVTLALIAAPAGYAGYSATLQLARVFGVPEEWWTLLSVIAALVIAVYAIDIVGRPCAVEGPKLRQIKLPERLRRHSWSHARGRASTFDILRSNLDLSASKFDVRAARERLRASKEGKPTHVVTDRRQG